MFHTSFTSFAFWVALIRFIACFCNMTQWFFAAVSLANLCCLFVFGLLPRCLSGLLFFWRNANPVGEFVGRLGVVVVFVML